MHDRGDGGDADRERDGGDGLDTAGEAVDEGLLLDVEDGRGEDGAVVVDLDDLHTVGERRDVEHVQQGSLGSSDLVADSDDLNVVDNLDRSSGNLGGDTEGLEERGLSGLHTGVSGRDVDVNGGDGTSLGRGGDDVGDDDLSDVLEVTRGEDESDVALDVGEQLLELGEVGHDGSESSSDHRVLSHEDDTLASERLSDLVDLLGRDVVDVAEEDRGVLLDQSSQLGEVDFLLGSSSSHFGGVCGVVVDE